MHNKTQQLLDSISTLIETRDFQGAAELLTKHIDTLQSQLDTFALLTLLEEFPVGLPVNLLYLKGQLFMQVGRYSEASYTLNRAKILAVQQQLLTQAINCCLKLATLYQQREDFQTARYHIQDAENIAHNIADQEARARLWLSLAELCPDIGQLEKSIQYARDAFHIFSMAGDCEGQFKALYLLAIVNRQLGQYDEASSRLEMARQCQQAGELSTAYHARVVSAEAHLLWHQGRISEAISKAQIFRRMADINNFPKQRVYAHILLGNLYRASGKYEEADQWYDETKTLISQYNLPLYAPWVEIQKGWLKILTADLPQARRYIHRALQTANKGLQMSFNVNLACLELLNGHFKTAENLFQSSRQFYANSGDKLSYHVIGLYLAYIHCHQGQEAEAIDHLQMALDWFTEHNILYFPHWWHPPIMAKVCGIALAAKICTPLVERILLTHLHQHETLLELRQHPDTAVRQRTLNLHLSLNNNGTDILAEVADATVKNILQDLLQNGPLRPDKFSQLQQKLATAKHRHKFNPTCVAVFGLYLKGCTRQQIASRLNCSETTVRNYITIIYQVFHLQSGTGKGTLARKEELRQLAEAAGFVIPET
jgi:tetratricopeptide (TPR) repeat protein/DNA-binding CsgD family transcriptional regulator